MDSSLILVNILVGLTIAFSCGCRLNMTSRRVYLRVRNRYAIIGSGALFLAFGHWIFPYWDGAYIGATIFAVSIVLGFWLDKRDWERGVPPSATMPGELGDETGRPVSDE